jgi:hypothetical protein
VRNAGLESRGDTGGMGNLLPEFAFKDGLLVIDAEDRSWRIRMWPEPCALRIRRDGIREEFRQVFRLIRPEIAPGRSKARDSRDIRTKGIPKSGRFSNAENLKSKAFADLRSQVPQSVAAVVEPFTNHQWNLLDLISKEKAAVDRWLSRYSFSV